MPSGFERNPAIAQIGRGLERVDRRVGGEHEDLELGPHAPESLDDVEAILAAEPEVADGEIRVEGLGHRALPVGRIAHLMALLGQKRRQRFTDRHLVVDYAESSSTSALSARGTTKCSAL